jgi:hypothetical protein
MAVAFVLAIIIVAPFGGLLIWLYIIYGKALGIFA